MSPEEYKQLDNILVAKLKEKFPEQDIKVRNDPLQGKLIGISYEKGGNLFEVYQLRNNGNEAEYQFIGTGQL